MPGLVRQGFALLALLAASCGDDEQQGSASAGDKPTKSASLQDNDTPLAKMASVITRPDVSGVPRGYQVMRAVAAERNAVLLVDQNETTVVPILIGSTEIYSIDMRLRGRTPPRPLTHDLLDTTLRELGAELVRVQVDDLRDGVFIGSVFIRQGARVIELDARPSDAIALAVGNKIPIYVADHVVAYAGTPADGTISR
jgi:bifunctional DNase/RNase